MAKRKAPAKKKAAKKAPKKAARKAARKAPKKAARRRAAKKPRAKRAPNPAFMKPLQPDETLAAVVGSNPIPRTEITKRLWAYIKRKGLQDRINRRNINADDTLRPLFGGKAQVSMFELTKLVAKHVR